MCEVKKENNPLSCVLIRNREIEIFNHKLDANKGIPSHYGDRFIPRRWTSLINEKNLKYINNGLPRDIFTLTSNYWRQHKFMQRMNNAFNLSYERILQLTDRKLLLNGLDLYVDWPCIPRPKPYAYQEMTYIINRGYIIAEDAVTDWSINGQIAISSGIDIIIYKTKEKITKELKMKYPTVLSYSPTGRFLAIGCITFHHPMLEIWFVQSQEFALIHRKSFKSEHLRVQCIEWDYYENSIICGTWLGTIYIFNFNNLKVIYKLQRHKKPITKIRLSPTLHYFASSDIDGTILIHKWPNVEEFSFVETNCKTSIVFDWHPWAEEYLVFAEQKPPSIMVYNVRLNMLEGFYKKRTKHINIDTISFNKLTGELIVSISKEERTSNVHEILVLSSLDSVVDVLKTTYCRTKFLTWSPDGTRLATTTNNDNTSFTIWNFYGQITFKSVNQKNLLLSLKNYFNNNQQQTKQYGFVFKKWSNLLR